MSLKLKALGLGLLAVLATSALAAMNASAETSGHFTHEGPTNHATVVGIESGTHRLHLKGDFGEGQIGCDKVSYHGTAAAKTIESLTITPKWEQCYTTGSNEPKWNVTTHGCTLTFTYTKNATEHKVHVLCPAGKAITIPHPNCTITVPQQTVNSAVTYDPVFETKDAITLTVNASFTAHYHAGICIFLGTVHTGTLSGSVTVKGLDTAGNQVPITATGA